MINKITEYNIIEIIKESKNLGSLTRSLNNIKNKHLLDTVISKTDFLDDNSDIKKRYYHIKNDFYYVEKCIFCSNDKHWSIKNKYIKTCNLTECRNKLKSYIFKDEKVHKKHSDNIKKYWNNVSSEYIEKRTKKTKETNIEKYGVDSYAKTKKFKEDMLENYGYISPFELKITHDKSKKTLISKYGVDHNFKIDGLQDKITETFQKNYGTDRPSQNEEIKQKGKDTCNEKYGGNSPMSSEIIRNKSIETLIKNYNVDSPLKSKEILKRYEDTMLERYGYKYYIQNIDNLEKLLKSRFKYKQINFNNNIINLQGYEDYVLFEILSKKYKPDDIFISLKDIKDETGIINYKEGNKIKKYYPDFYIKSNNKIYEVKSPYTYNIHLNKNLLKQQACLDLGLDFEFIIIDPKTYKEWKKCKLNTLNII